MKDLEDRMEHIAESIRSTDDKLLVYMLLDHAWTNMRVADEPEIHQAYVTIICELVPVPRIEDVKAILTKAWEDTEEQRERSLGS